MSSAGLGIAESTVIMSAIADGLNGATVAGADTLPARELIDIESAAGVSGDVGDAVAADGREAKIFCGAGALSNRGRSAGNPFGLPGTPEAENRITRACVRAAASGFKASRIETRSGNPSAALT